MKTSHEDIHDRLVATYQSLEASILNRVLRENGIEDIDTRRSVISGFLFEQGITLDQMWFKEDKMKFYPGVFFSTKPHDHIKNGTVHLPCPEYGMNFHEYAHGATEWAMENEDGGDVIETGND